MLLKIKKPLKPIQIPKFSYTVSTTDLTETQKKWDGYFVTNTKKISTTKDMVKDMMHIHPNFRTEAMYIKLVRDDVNFFFHIPRWMQTHEVCLAFVRAVHDILTSSSILKPKEHVILTIYKKCLVIIPSHIKTSSFYESCLDIDKTIFKAIPENDKSEELCENYLLRSLLENLKVIPDKYFNEQFMQDLIKQYEILYGKNE